MEAGPMILTTTFGAVNIAIRNIAKEIQLARMMLGKTFME